MFLVYFHSKVSSTGNLSRQGGRSGVVYPRLVEEPLKAKNNFYCRVCTQQGTLQVSGQNAASEIFVIYILTLSQLYFSPIVFFFNSNSNVQVLHRLISKRPTDKICKQCYLLAWNLVIEDCVIIGQRTWIRIRIR